MVPLREISCAITVLNEQGRKSTARTRAFRMEDFMRVGVCGLETPECIKAMLSVC